MIFFNFVDGWLVWFKFLAQDSVRSLEESFASGSWVIHLLIFFWPETNCNFVKNHTRLLTKLCHQNLCKTLAWCSKLCFLKSGFESKGNQRLLPKSRSALWKNQEARGLNMNQFLIIKFKTWMKKIQLNVLSSYIFD